MKYEVYKIQNKTNSKVYIGITTQGYNTRFRNHLKEVRTGSTFILHNSIRKYGEDKFFTTLLEEVDSIELLKEREKYYINLFNSTNRDKGYNMTLGGDGTFGRLHSEDTKTKITNKAKGRKSHRALQVTLTNLMTNEVNVYNNMGEASLAIGKTAFYIAHLKQTCGNNFSQGDYNFNLESTFKPKVKIKKEIDLDKMRLMQQKSKEVRAANPEYYRAIAKKAQEGKRKTVIQLDLNGNIVNEYLSREDAIKFSGYAESGIAQALMNKREEYKGFKWKYKD